ncbi:hypothetical protein [Bryobacter aggregatus]|uniref:hypothetical protein n=1 Tax=Bryobacter aggregatus TaxID=360054 RepID=UPI0012BADBF4|nr:hypothetical protein [Bryobacter aggregatus]
MELCAYRGRKAYRLENDQLRLTVLAEGGHIAELLHRSSGVNPLWTPPWPTIEPSAYSPEQHPEYGSDAESKLLSGIMGHNWCVDLFGPPSKEEAAAGYTVHGEASVVAYDKDFKAHLPLSQLDVQRQIALEGNRVAIVETVRNLLPFDRSIAWQEHVTLGPPFVERGVTRLHAPILRSAKPNGEEFEWQDRVYPTAMRSADFHAHLLTAGAVAIENPRLGLELRYDWNLQDFPWLGIWEENCDRQFAPWNGETLTWGIEFGASPFPEYRFRRATRGLFWGAPTAVWLPAHGVREIRYGLTLQETGA